MANVRYGQLNALVNWYVEWIPVRMMCYYAFSQMTERTGMILSKAPNIQKDGVVSLQREQHEGRYWPSKSLTHLVLDAKDDVRKTTEPPQMSMATYYLKLQFDHRRAKMDHAEAWSFVVTLQMVLNSHSVEAGVGQKLHLLIPIILGIWRPSSSSRVALCDSCTAAFGSSHNFIGLPGVFLRHVRRWTWSFAFADVGRGPISPIMSCAYFIN